MPPELTKRRFLKSLLVAGVASNAPADWSDNSLLNAPLAPSLPKQRDLVFLFQGDSITDGNRGRSTDPNHIMGHGYAFSVASRIGADFPERNLTFYNRGISGNRLTDLQKRWQADTLALKPDVLSLLIGINDTIDYVNNPERKSTGEEFEQGYRDLLMQCREQNPGMLLVLGLPFAYPVGRAAQQWERWQEDVARRQAVIRKLAVEFDGLLVDYSAVLDKAIAGKNIEYWVWDGIHPTVFAHEILAREWIKQVRQRLTFLKKYHY